MLSPDATVDQVQRKSWVFEVRPAAQQPLCHRVSLPLLFHAMCTTHLLTVTALRVLALGFGARPCCPHHPSPLTTTTRSVHTGAELGDDVSNEPA